MGVETGSGSVVSEAIENEKGLVNANRKKTEE